MASVAAKAVRTERARAPGGLLLCALGAAALALGVTATALGAANGVSEVQVGLLVWVSVPYVGAGLAAWVRRPESRLGPLMVAGGLVSGLSTLQLAHTEWLLTIGGVFDILPAALFLHVYLAYPEGRLRSGFERRLVGAAYFLAIGLQLVKLGLGVSPNSIAVT